MRYVLTDEFTKIEETSGVIVNISNVDVEINDKPEHSGGVILFPKHPFPFNKTVYASRSAGAIGTAIIAVVQTGMNQQSGGGSGGGDCCCDDIPTTSEIESIVAGTYDPESKSNAPTLEEIKKIIAGTYPSSSDTSSDTDITGEIASESQIRNIINGFYKK